MNRTTLYTFAYTLKLTIIILQVHIGFELDELLYQVLLPLLSVGHQWSDSIPFSRVNISSFVHQGSKLLHSGGSE